MEEREGTFLLHKICPFHDDDEASLAVYSSGTYYCFGCGAYGKVEELGPNGLKTTKREKLLNTQRREEVRLLYKEIADITHTVYFNLDQVDMKLYKYLQRKLFETGRFKYFVKRGLTVKVIRENYLGWTGTRYSFPMFRNGDAYSLTLRRSEINTSSKFKYFNLANTCAVLYNIHSIKKHKSIIIAEGQMDCLSLMQFGIPATCSTSGAVGFNKKWATTILKEKNIYLLMDNDRGGELGRELITEYFEGNCEQIYVPQEFGDINEFLVGTDQKTFLDHIQKEVERANNF